MRIGIDIDGVLNDEAAFLIDYGTKFSVENSLEYLVDSSQNGTHNIFNWLPEINVCFWEKYYKTYLTSDRYIRQFSAEIISMLYEKHEIHIITARNTHNTKLTQSEIEKFTENWLINNNFKYDWLIFTEQKREYINKNSIDIMIEDNPDLVMELHQNMPVLCYNTTYNNHVIGNNIIRVSSWYDIYRIFKEIQ